MTSPNPSTTPTLILEAAVYPGGGSAPWMVIDTAEKAEHANRLVVKTAPLADRQGLKRGRGDFLRAGSGPTPGVG